MSFLFETLVGALGHPDAKHELNQEAAAIVGSTQVLYWACAVQGNLEDGNCIAYLVSDDRYAMINVCRRHVPVFPRDVG